MSKAEIGRIFGLVVISLLALSAIVGAPRGSPPQITFINFPTVIQADGSPVTGLIFFEDLDGDIVKVRFELLEGDRAALQLSPDWEFDPPSEGPDRGRDRVPAHS